MSLFEERRKRKAQARANAYIKSLKGKEIKDIEKSFLDNKEFENNEISEEEYKREIMLIEYLKLNESEEV